MGDHHHHGGAIGPRVDLLLCRDADEAGVVVAPVLHRGGKGAKPVKRSARGGGQGGNVVSAAFRHHFRRHGGVGTDGDLHVPKRPQKARALVERLLVGADLPDVFHLRAPSCKQAVIHLQTKRAHDAEIIFDHQIVYRIHRACGAVFDGQNAVAAFALLDGLEHPLEILIIGDLGQGKQLFASLPRVGTLHALASNPRLFGEEQRGILHCILHRVLQSRCGMKHLLLKIFAQLHHQSIQNTGVRLIFGSCLLGNVGKPCPLSCGIKDGQSP